MARWFKESDCGTDMLRCGKCDARVVLDHYRKAVGLKGYDYCPYCGTHMDRPKDIAERIKWLQPDCPWK